MTVPKKKLGRLAKALLETAADMLKSELLDRATFERIATRLGGPADLPE
jgi:hypothetical protein